MSTYKLVLRRLADDWKLLLSIFVGITVAAALVAGAPVYLRTLERQGINTAIDRASQIFLNLFVFAPYVPLDRTGIEDTDRAIDRAVEDNVASLFRGRERYIKTSTLLVGTADRPISDEDGDRVSRGYFQQLTNVADHLTFLSGVMATDRVVPGEGGPTVEGVISSETASVFGLQVGDIVLLAPSVGSPVRVNVEVVGVAEATDPREEFWQENATIYLHPAPLEEDPDPGLEVEPQEPPLPVFVTREALIDGVGAAFPGSLVSSTWFIFVDKESVKALSKEEVRAKLATLESDISRSMQRSAVFTGITRLLNDFEQRSFFSSVPLLLLLVLMVITVLYYVSMMVSYLVRSREDDVALLRGRGVNGWQLVRLYALEGSLLVLAATIFAPFLAMGTVAIAGKLGYFREITLGETLPVAFHWVPFAAAAGTGLLTMAIFVIPGVLGARAGLVTHKLRASRPPSTPFFQRYYLDVSLLAIGGLVFWELFARGHLISGGLFSSVEINEALLLAPVLLLTVVALLFMRFFPMMVRYLSGDSAALLHLLAGATLSALALTVAVAEIRASSGLGWLWDVAHVGAIGAVYYGTQRAGRSWGRWTGLVLQAGLIALLIYGDVPDTDQVSFIPTVITTLLVPLEILFLLMRRLSRSYPAWASMAIWRMARRPLQYSWLVLLLVMVTGLGVLATTVGGTLDRSHKDRIFYAVGSDLRVSGVPTYIGRGLDNLKQRYLRIPGVTSISLAMRSRGLVGSTYSGRQFDVLAVESEEFPYITWYREDFSERPLTHIMRALQSRVKVQIEDIPEGATGIRMWAKPQDPYPNMFLWAVFQDSRGVVDTVSFGKVGPPEWTLMETEIPRSLEGPLNLVSLQIYEPVFGPVGTAGSMLLDDIQITFGFDREVHLVDDFEGPNKWTTLATSVISSDFIEATGDDAHGGQRSGRFSFGRDTDRGIRGFYRSTNYGPIPVVASTSFAWSTGTEVGDSLIVTVDGRFVPIIIMDTVDYFPTLNPSFGGFILADLDNMVTHLNILSPMSSASPNELYLATVPGSLESVREVAYSLAPGSGLVHDAEALLESVRLDPLVVAGWKAMVLVAIGVILFTATLGYAAYLLTFSAESRSETGFLRALGFSGRQMMWLVGAEHMAILLLGLALGTVSGFAMSNVLISAVAVTERGDPVLPPFVITTNWAFMGPIYVALMVVFAAALYWLTRSASGVDISGVTRVEGE